MNISGAGHIPAGDYNEKISISGSGKLDGNIRCTAFSVSGAASGVGSVECSGRVGVSGSARIAEDLTANEVHVSGALKVMGNCTAEQMIRVSGGMSCDGTMKCAALAVSGGIRVNGGIEAEKISISGMVTTDGLMNAEEIEIKLAKAKSTAGSVGGSSIKIHSGAAERIFGWSVWSGIFGRCEFKVDESIEGDEVYIENVTAPLVVGRVVTVGEKCKIGLVQYSESIEVHPKAQVEKCEKI